MMGRKIGVALILLLVAVCSVVYGQSNQCTTPDQRQGDCINLKQCPELLTRLTASDRTQSDIEFVRHSMCGFDNKDPLVCCPTSNVPTEQPSTYAPPINGDSTNTPPTNGGNNSPINNQLLPTNCGKQESDRIFGGNRTDLYQYPWMALLEFDTPNGVNLACGGALINNRYVMTAAHCLKGRSLPATWRLNRVRLGEYNIETEPDCIPDGDTGSICAPPVLIVPVEEQIAHEDYNPQNIDQRYDIALLRLSQDVVFTSFIRPICLPRTSSLEPKFRIAGWGRTENRGQSDVKLQVTVPFVNNPQCSQVYQSLGIILGAGQICAGGEDGKDSCTGDSGGPLMEQDRYPDGDIRWNAVGVVSFGPRVCGTYSIPGVYSKVYDFMPWITSKLRQ